MRGTVLTVRKKPERVRSDILIQEPEDFVPEYGYDHCLPGTISIDGFYLLHQNSPNCWCEPYITEFSEEDDGWLCEHRWTLH